MNTIDLLSKVSGRPKDEILAIWEKVKGNHERLNSCEGHAFQPTDGNKKFYTCACCQGEITARDYKWFLRGVKQGEQTK
jgi:hypothetical protein